ncbi:TonB-dependent receptor domain-containing protein [Aquirufa sp. ROCK2-A2]
MKAFQGMPKISLLTILLFSCPIVPGFGQDSTKILREVIVQEQKSDIQYSPSKKIYQISGNITTIGGNLLDALANIPSLYINPDGIIQYRGNQNMTIYFDGKPSGFVNSSKTNALSLFPLDMVERVEIISSPGANFSSEGSSGILNIILKKGTQMPSSFKLTANFGTRDKYSVTSSYAKTSKKFTQFLDYNFRKTRRNDYQNLFRENPSSNGFARIYQEMDEINRDENHTLKWGNNWQITTENNLVVSFLGRAALDENNEIRQNRTKYLSSPQRLYIRDALKKGTDYGFDFSISYQTKKRKSESSLDFLWINNVGKDRNDFVQNYYYNDFETFNSNIPQRLERSANDNQNHTFILQGDWIQKIKPKANWGYGFKWSNRSFSNQFSYEKWKTNLWQIDRARSNQFDYDENIAALYTQWTQTLHQWDFQAGLRAELSLIYLPIQNISNNYLNAFPSFSAVNNKNVLGTISFNLSSRINRPSYKSLNPFISFADPINLSSGNPNLKPEKTLLMEMGQAKDFKHFSINNQLFYRKTHDLVGRFRTLQDGDTTLTRFENIEKFTSWGFENITSWQVNPIWKIQLNGSIYQNDLQGKINELTINQNRWSYNGRLNQTFKLVNNWTAQIIGVYQSTQISALGQIAPIYSIDLGIKKEFMQGKLTFNAKINDLFNTQRTQYHFDSFGYVLDLEKKKETRIYYLGFTYKLEGKKKIKDPKQRKSINEEEAGLEDD